MNISKPFEWDWESRETAQDIRFREKGYPAHDGGLLITRKNKRGRVNLYKAYYFTTQRQGEAQFFPSDHGGARGARKAALKWIKYRHWETSGKRIINAMKEYQRSKGL
jgi:hypothetical protein